MRKLEPYTPNTYQNFWCSHCDKRAVDSFEPKTGNFYLQSGQSYSMENKEYEGAYTIVMYALCCKCCPIE